MLSINSTAHNFYSLIYINKYLLTFQSFNDKCHANTQNKAQNGCQYIPTRFRRQNKSPIIRLHFRDSRTRKLTNHGKKRNQSDASGRRQSIQHPSFAVFQDYFRAPIYFFQGVFCCIFHDSPHIIPQHHFYLFNNKFTIFTHQSNCKTSFTLH